MGQEAVQQPTTNTAAYTDFISKQLLRRPCSPTCRLQSNKVVTPGHISTAGTYTCYKARMVLSEVISQVFAASIAHTTHGLVQATTSAVNMYPCLILCLHRCIEHGMATGGHDLHLLQLASSRESKSMLICAMDYINHIISRNNILYGDRTIRGRDDLNAGANLPSGSPAAGMQSGVSALHPWASCCCSGME